MADAIYWDTSALISLVTADTRMRDAARIAGIGVIEP
jgi:hypothetical protein